MLNPLSIFSVTALDLAHIYPSDHSLRGASSVFLPARDQHLKISSCLDFLVGSHQNNPPNQAVYSVTTIITCPWNDMHLHEILTQQGFSHLEILPNYILCDEHFKMFSIFKSNRQWSCFTKMIRVAQDQLPEHLSANLKMMLLRHSFSHLLQKLSIFFIHLYLKGGP